MEETQNPSQSNDLGLPDFSSEPPTDGAKSSTTGTASGLLSLFPKTSAAGPALRRSLFRA